MPRLALLSEFPTLAGGEQSMLSTLPALLADGFEITVLAPPGGPLEQAVRALGVAFHPLVTSRAARADGTGGTAAASLPNPPPAVPHLSSAREQLSDQLRRLRPDLLHANSLAMARLAGPVAAQLSLASVAHLRDIVRLSAKAVGDINRNSRILAVSAATRQHHLAAGLDPSRSHVLYNGVDLGYFRPRPASGYLHRELDLPANARLIAMIGQICLRKGQDVFVRAASTLAKRDASLHFLVVGKRFSAKEESRQFELSARTFASEHLPGRMHWLGTRSDVARLMNELSLLLHPARQEPLGRVLLEGAASGLPVVATNVGGTAEIFMPDSSPANVAACGLSGASSGAMDPATGTNANEIAALLVPPDEHDVMAEAAWSILANRSFADRLSRAARRRAEKAFDIRLAAANLRAHYEAVLS